MEKVEEARKFLMTSNVVIAWQQTAAWVLTVTTLLGTTLHLTTAWTQIASWQVGFWLVVTMGFWTNYFQLIKQRSLSRTIVELAEEADPVK